MTSTNPTTLFPKPEEGQKQPSSLFGGASGTPLFQKPSGEGSNPPSDKPKEIPTGGLFGAKPQDGGAGIKKPESSLFTLPKTGNPTGTGNSEGSLFGQKPATGQNLPTENKKDSPDLPGLKPQPGTSGAGLFGAKPLAPQSLAGTSNTTDPVKKENQPGDIFSKSLPAGQDKDKKIEPGNIFSKGLPTGSGTDDKTAKNEPGNIFSKPADQTGAKPETQTASIFGQPKTTQPTSNSPDQKAQQPTSLFGGQNKPAEPKVDQPSSTSTDPKTQPGNIFGKTSEPKSDQPQSQPASIFGQPKTTQPTPTDPKAQPGDIFGKPSEPKSDQPQPQPASVFGQPKTTQPTPTDPKAQPGDIFGKPSEPKSDQPQPQPASIFGQPKTTQPTPTDPKTQPTSLFPKPDQPPTQTGSLLGQPKLTQPTTVQPQNQPTNLLGKPSQPGPTQTQIQPKDEKKPEGGLLGARPQPATQGQGTTLFSQKPAEQQPKTLGSGFTGLDTKPKEALGLASNPSGTLGGGLQSSQSKPTLGGFGQPQAGLKVEPQIGGGKEDITIEKLLQSWKGDLDKQVQTFAELNKALEQHEVDAYKNIDMGETLLKSLQEMEKEYRAIELACDGIDKGQNNLMQKLNVVEQELSGYLYKDETKAMKNDGKMSRTDLINQAKKLNSEISKLEGEMVKLVNEMSQPVGGKENEHLSEDLLDSYFDALQSVETETLRSITKLNKIETEIIGQ